MRTRLLRSIYNKYGQWSSTLPSSLSPRRSFQSVVLEASQTTRALSPFKKRAVALGLVAGSSLSIAAYQFHGSRRLHCDSEAEEYRARRRYKTGPLSYRWDADYALSQRSETHIPNSLAGFRRFDFAQLGSNEPIEDYHSELFVPPGPQKGYWSFFAILDGHAGYQTAAWLSDHLLPTVSRTLRFFDSPASSTSLPEDSKYDDSIIKAFLSLDQEIVYDAVERALADPSAYNAIRALERANAGSCALVAFYDASNSLLKIANTGDSRAVLGRKTITSDGQIKYEVKPLSFDHNGYNQAEVERLTKLHPDEDLFKDGRFIGWGCSRAFGDGRTKWSKEIQEKLKREYISRAPAKTLLTPPYFTAEPEVTTQKVQEGDFLIMATDGLWECLTNEEAVGLVGKWIDGQQRSVSLPGGSADLTETSGVVDKNSLPVIPTNEKDDTARYDQWGKKKVFTLVEGDTSAQHLVRNALGGANDDLRAALLALRTPHARGFRDDISVTVVMF